MPKKSQPSSSSLLDFARPLVTVDVAVFTVFGDALHVLLARRPDDAAEPFPGAPCLPGGFVDVERDESLHACALRKLREKTGYAAPYLEQLASWGSRDRDPRGWSTTHAWMALVPPPTPDAESARAAGWQPADAACRQKLAFDHADILRSALERLRSKVEYTSLPAFLLAEPFTLPALQQAYETVLGRPLDKSAFRKRMLDGGFLDEVGSVSGASGRTAMGYRVTQRERATVFPRTFRSGE